MNLTFNRKKNEARRLTKQMQDYLRRHFMLKESYLNELKYFEDDSVFQDQPVKRIHVFQDQLAHKQKLIITNASDLKLHPEVLVFEGHINTEGKVYFADRRIAMHKTVIN